MVWSAFLSLRAGHSLSVTQYWHHLMTAGSSRNKIAASELAGGTCVHCPIPGANRTRPIAVFCTACAATSAAHSASTSLPWVSAPASSTPTSWHHGMAGTAWDPSGEQSCICMHMPSVSWHDMRPNKSPCTDSTSQVPPCMHKSRFTSPVCCQRMLQHSRIQLWHGCVPGQPFGVTWLDRSCAKHSPMQAPQALSWLRGSLEDR